MVEVATLRSADEVSELLRSSEGPFDVIGSNSKRRFRLSHHQVSAPIAISIASTGIVDFEVSDQVVKVGGGTPIDELQAELRKKNQMLPMPSGTEIPAAAAGCPGTVAGTLSMNLPHASEGVAGSWRDWVIGMTVVLADGSVVKCGSRAVKSVAGYDLHKLFIGSRGTLGVVCDVILRTFPCEAFDDLKPDWDFRGLPDPFFRGFTSDWIQRTKRGFR